MADFLSTAGFMPIRVAVIPAEPRQRREPESITPVCVHGFRVPSLRSGPGMTSQRLCGLVLFLVQAELLNDPLLLGKLRNGVAAVVRRAEIEGLLIELLHGLDI